MLGQEVHQGDKIGLVGSTGNSTGAHLHLEISKSTSLAQGDLIDPATVLGLKK
ncbi:M23 family metallopeptidase [Enterococcus cecorum]